MKRGRPALLALDFANGTARRYWPKPGDQRPQSFITQEALLVKPDDVAWETGSEKGRGVLEAFRSGKLPIEALPDVENQPEVA